MRIPFSLAAAQLRRGWRELVAIALLVALVGGLSLAGFAGAERTSLAVERMVDSTAAADVLVNPDSGDDSELDFDEIAALPMVADSSRIHGVALFSSGHVDSIEEFFEAPLTMATDGRALFDFARPVMTDGRMIDPQAVDEVFLDRTYAAAAGYTVGDAFTWSIATMDELIPAFEKFEAGDQTGGIAMLNDPAFGTVVRLRVVGIGNLVDGVVVDRGFEPVAAWVSSAFYARYDEPSAGYGGALVRLGRPEDIGDFAAAVNAMVPDELVVYQTLDSLTDKAVHGAQPAAVALMIFAAVTALLGLLLLVQAISRRLQLDSRDVPALAAIGTTQMERAIAAVVRISIATLAGSIGAVLLAVLLSGLTPVGPARYAEPNPGFRFDASILIGGAAVFAVVVVLLAVVPAWRAARLEQSDRAQNGSALARWIGDLGGSPSVTTGVRFGLEPGRGSTAVPTRATIIGAVTAVGIAAATIVFAASLDRVVHDGEFYGSNFDLIVDFDGDALDQQGGTDRVISILMSDPDVERAGELQIDELVIDGRRTPTLAFTTGVDAVLPTIAAGRAPIGQNEIALGATTMERLGVGIGDVVDVEGSPVEVVARVVLPGVGLYQGSDRTSIGVGALASTDTFDARGGAPKRFALVDLLPGSDVTEFEERMSDALGPFGSMIFQAGFRPSDIDSLAQLRSLPIVLSSVLVLVVAVTVVNAMFVAVRRRRRDVAVLRVLGATSRSVTMIGAWQGTTIAGAGLLFGVPLGVVAGRSLWIVLADNFGTLARPVVPVAAVLALIGVVLLIGAASGAMPARGSLRHHPATVLRTE